MTNYDRCREIITEYIRETKAEKGICLYCGKHIVSGFICIPENGNTCANDFVNAHPELIVEMITG